MKNIISVVGTCIAVIFIVLCVKFLVVDIVRVDGNSMNPTLKDNNRVLVTKVFSPVKQGDIIVLDSNYYARQLFYTTTALDKHKTELNLWEKAVANFKLSDDTERKYYIKRVIATEGQTVDIRDDGVYVDDELLTETYTQGITSAVDKAVTYPVTVGKGQLFVLGDNRENSEDSRSSKLGLVDNRAVLGKAFVCIYPFKAI